VKLKTLNEMKKKIIREQIVKYNREKLKIRLKQNHYDEKLNIQN
jgi:hypothetical protein